MKNMLCTTAVATLFFGFIIEANGAGVSTSRSNIPRKSSMAVDTADNSNSNNSTGIMDGGVPKGKGEPGSGMATGKADIAIDEPGVQKPMEKSEQGGGTQSERLLPTVNKKTGAASSGNGNGGQTGKFHYQQIPSDSNGIKDIKSNDDIRLDVKTLK